jgi:hypothetical protein
VAWTKTREDHRLSSQQNLLDRFSIWTRLFILAALATKQALHSLTARAGKFKSLKRSAKANDRLLYLSITNHRSIDRSIGENQPLRGGLTF